jgi:hypothetical protein
MRCAGSGGDEEGADLAGDAVRLVQREEGVAAFDLYQAGIGKRCRQPARESQRATAAFLNVRTEPGMARIMLIDAPAVLGAQAESDVSESDIGLVVQLLSRGIELGRIAPQPVMPLARILLGALREAAVFLASPPTPRPPATRWVPS